MRLVTFNGPIGCGKSWVSDKLEERLTSQRIRVQRVSFQDTLRIATMALLGATGMNYGEFKRTEFHGLTGRQWMIGMSEDFAKTIHPHFFSIRLIEEMQKIQDATRDRIIFIADSNGFPEELDYCRSREGLDVLACSIEPEGSPARGEKWMEGDSRINLAHKCNIVTEDSTSMLSRVMIALTNRGWAKYAA